ncbi:hypothetical protein JYK04_00401 [Streptomyces nojiriensis]|nr:hypothetical protein JYK04_00401 [Streptomyces nojiriensis]
MESQAGRGQWFCALEWARLLGHRGKPEQALEVLAPYIATNWWPTIRARAGLLEDWGRVEEAIAPSRPYAEAGDRLALVCFARLLAPHDRSGEAFILPRAGIQDRFLAECLVDVAEAAPLLEARVEAAVPARNDPDCNSLRMKPSNAVGLPATIRERLGRIEEAIALLHTREATSVNGRDQLTDLLARHDRITELRVYAASEHHGHALQRLAEVPEERGDMEGAIAALPRGATPDGMWHVAVPLSELLVRHGWGDEAIEQTRAHPEGDTWYAARALSDVLAEAGRTEEAAAVLEQHPTFNRSLRAELLIDLGHMGRRLFHRTTVLTARARTHHVSTVRRGPVHSLPSPSSTACCPRSSRPRRSPPAQGSPGRPSSAAWHAPVWASASSWPPAPLPPAPTRSVPAPWQRGGPWAGCRNARFPLGIDERPRRFPVEARKRAPVRPNGASHARHRPRSPEQDSRSIDKPHDRYDNGF